MTSSEITVSFQRAVLSFDRDGANAIIEKAISNGMSAEDVVFQVVIPTMDGLAQFIGEGHQTNLAQHFMVAQICSEITIRLTHQFRKVPSSGGKIIIGTAFGDMHSLGKRIVSSCLNARMIEVEDLGVNVKAETFVEAAEKAEARVIAVSAMMLHTANGENGCRRVRQLLHDKGLERDIKLVVGGAPFRFDPLLWKTVGADAWAEDGVSASKVIHDLMDGGELK